VSSASQYESQLGLIMRRGGELSQFETFAFGEGH